MSPRARNIVGAALAVLMLAYFVGERSVGAERGVPYMVGYGLGQLLVYGVPVVLIAALVWFVVRRRLRPGD